MLRTAAYPSAIQWLADHVELANRAGECVNEAIYRLYGAGAVNPDAAEQAYQWLFKHFPDAYSLTIATTNYDPSATIACARIFGEEPLDGFSAPTYGSTPVFDTEAVVGQVFSDRRVPTILHLHGAVSWYRQPDGGIIKGYLDAPFNPDSGVPVFLPPDPSKNYLNDARVQALWRAFRRALREADCLVVIGHNMADKPLVDSIAEFAGGKPLAILKRSPELQVTNLRERGVDAAVGIRLAFDPSVLSSPNAELERFVGDVRGRGVP